MCWIMYKPAGIKMKYNYMDEAQSKNEDGYGVSWYDEEEGGIQTFKTMNYKRFKAVLSTLKNHDAIIHLRKVSKGIVCMDNNHPFNIPSGVMFHNGTIYKIDRQDPSDSDTKALADLISECTYEYIYDIKPLIQSIIGDTLNKLVFLENDGEITIMNDNLGIWDEDGCWYSNEYHLPKKSREPFETDYVYTYNHTTGKYEPTSKAAKKADAKKSLESKKIPQISHTIFVYGTLKKDFHNYHYLKDSEFVGEAESVEKWAMIGKDLPFPYLLHKDSIKGHKIKGEVYRVTQSTFEAIEQLEGYPTHYKRDYINVTVGNTVIVCTTYVKATSAPDWVTGKDYINEFEKPSYKAIRYGTYY